MMLYVNEIQIAEYEVQKYIAVGIENSLSYLPINHIGQFRLRQGAHVQSTIG